MTKLSFDGFDPVQVGASMQSCGPSAMDLANQIGLPVLEISQERQLLRASKAGMQLFRDDSPLRLVDREVRAAQVEDDLAFLSLLKAARLRADGQPLPWRLGRDHRWPAIYGTVCAHGDTLMVVAIEPRRQWFPVEGQFIRYWFGLTAKETQVGERLSVGASVDDTARSLGITVGTAKTHVKNIFVKLGISRHGDLIHLLSLLRVSRQPDEKPPEF